MKRLITWILLFWVACAHAQDWVKLEHTSVRLVSEYQTIDGREPFWVLLEFKIKPGWHTYWQNPGDSGTAPKLNWNMPQGFTASPIHWLPPTQIAAGPFVNYGYSASAYHLIQITPAKDYKASFVPIELSASWLVCEQECVPEKADFSLNVAVGNKNIASAEFDRINALVAKTQLTQINPKWQQEGDKVKLVFEQKLTGDAYFFVAQKGVVEPSQPQQLITKGDSSELLLDTGVVEPQWPLSGVLKVKQDGKDKFFHVVINGPSVVQAADESQFLPLILLFAVLGGLILNLMPCVFPVLSLKILALKSSANKRMQGVMYTLGVVITFALIAVVMIALQSAGTKVGWGFQMQSPLFIIGLIYLFTLVALNLFGFYEIPFSLQTNLTWQNRHQLLYSFATGVLACIVATPCSAPFMATAVGVALTKSAVEALLIFIFLGVGLALPYLLICFVPRLAALLPKPGQWMETMKQLLAFPMLLSVVWLVWVLGQQIPFDGVALILISLCFVLFTFWLWQRMASFKTKLIAMLVGLSLVVYPVFWMQQNELLVYRKVMTTEQFSQQKLDALLKQKKKVFVYATAAWCITCKLNEKVALDTDTVKQAFKQKDIVLLKADWTNQDQTIYRYLQRFGRAGVPLYVYYAPGKPPKILPQILTPGIIIDAIKE